MFKFIVAFNKEHPEHVHHKPINFKFVVVVMRLVFIGIAWAKSEM